MLFLCLPDALHAGTFLSDHGNKQVIAPFLIILRVANQRSLTGDSIVPRNISSLHFGSKWKSSGRHDTLPSGYSMDSTDVDEKTPGVLGIGTESSVDPRQDVV